MPTFLTWYLDKGPNAFGEYLEEIDDLVDKSMSNIAQVANDVVGIMSQVVTQDTGELSRQMKITDSDVSGTVKVYQLGSTALNRSGLEYAYYEHMRHEGSSFLDIGEQYANDMLFEGTTAILNSLG